ncbi:hypothetical protein MVEG_04270 [Podila verticillata NRRL 6337]|nr:hypothetical protein MVEG_04270 [Podila verticillata NRRL 6337]
MELNGLALNSLLELQFESGCEATGQKNPEYELESVPGSLIKQLGCLTLLEKLKECYLIDQVTHCIRSPRKNLADLFCMLSTLGRLKELEIRGLKDYFSDVELMERQEQCEQIKWVLFT